MKITLVNKQLMKLEDGDRSVYLPRYTITAIGELKLMLKRCPSARVRKIVSLKLESVASPVDLKALRYNKTDRLSLIKHYQRLDESGCPEYYKGWPVLQAFVLSPQGLPDVCSIEQEYSILMDTSIQLCAKSLVTSMEEKA